MNAARLHMNEVDMAHGSVHARTVTLLRSEEGVKRLFVSENLENALVSLLLYVFDETYCY